MRWVLVNHWAIARFMIFNHHGQLAVVAFSVVAQSLTMPPLLRAIGEIPSPRQTESTRTKP